MLGDKAMQIEPIMPIPMEGSNGLGTPTGVPHKAQPVHTAPAPPNPDAKVEDKQALGELDQAMESFNISLKFSKDAETGTIVVEMIDQKSGETLEQFPTATTLHVSAELRKLQGKIINCNA
jgi:uncharacterized FlaG/YvyC family protein